MSVAALANYDMEATLIGSVLSFPKVAAEASFLKADDFAYDPNRAIWRELQKRIDAGSPISALAVAQSLTSELQEHGGAKHLMQLMSLCISQPRAASWATELKTLSLRRRAIEILRDGVETLSNPDEEQTAEEQIAQIGTLLERAARDALPRMLTEREIREQEVHNLRTPIIAYDTGFQRLNVAMGGGIQRRKAYAFAGRMKSGKTLLASQISHSLNASGVRHVYFACEMGASQIEHRAMASELGVNSLAFLDERSRSNVGFISRAGSAAVSSPGNILYRDAPGLTFDQLRRDVSHAILGRGCQGFILDYLQLVGGQRRGATKAEHLDELSQWIAEVCYKHNVFAIVMCQLNQEGNVRGGEGIKLAFDQVYELRRSDGGEGQLAWLDMMATRYTKWEGVGSEAVPAFTLNSSIGPRFEPIGGDGDG